MYEFEKYLDKIVFSNQHFFSLYSGVPDFVIIDIGLEKFLLKKTIA